MGLKPVIAGPVSVESDAGGAASSNVVFQQNTASTWNLNRAPVVAFLQGASDLGTLNLNVDTAPVDGDDLIIVAHQEDGTWTLQPSAGVKIEDPRALNTGAHDNLTGITNDFRATFKFCAAASHYLDAPVWICTSANAA